jgi:RNA polymerase sigma-70 factor, ECF subfamily
VATLYSPTDAVIQAQRGNMAALRELFDRYQRGVYNTVFGIVGNEADAADVTQDVFIRAFRALPRLQAPEAFTSWLFRIATNLSRNHLRDRGRARTESLDAGFEGDEESAGHQVADAAPEPSSQAETAELQNRVRTAIQGLTDNHRLVVTLHHLEGMPVEEIATLMGISEGTVKSRLSRAREQLRRKLVSYVEA